MTEHRAALAALREAWHEEDQAEAQMSAADYDGEKRMAERRLIAARAAAREAEAAAGVALGAAAGVALGAAGTPHVNDIAGPHPESPDWHAGYRAGRSEGPGLDALREALREIEIVLGPRAHEHGEGGCDGCGYEVNEALRLARAALAAQENPT